jgi:hypothetical protein
VSGIVASDSATTTSVSAGGWDSASSSTITSSEAFLRAERPARWAQTSRAPTARARTSSNSFTQHCAGWRNTFRRLTMMMLDTHSFGLVDTPDRCLHYRYSDCVQSQSTHSNYWSSQDCSTKNNRNSSASILCPMALG